MNMKPCKAQNNIVTLIQMMEMQARRSSRAESRMTGQRHNWKDLIVELLILFETSWILTLFKFWKETENFKNTAGENQTFMHFWRVFLRNFFIKRK